jgi:hypothetical protein
VITIRAFMGKVKETPDIDGYPAPFRVNPEHPATYYLYDLDVR